MNIGFHDQYGRWYPASSPPPHGPRHTTEPVDGPFSFGGPYAPTALPTEDEARKKLPIATGVIDYFPDAFAAIAELSRIGNDKHNPGQPLHWSRGKSDDHPDALMRHFIERGKMDVNGVRHSTQVAWRALAMLQLELEAAAIASMEEQAWRLQRDHRAVCARAWPEPVDLPCDVEPAGHGEGAL